MIRNQRELLRLARFALVCSTENVPAKSPKQRSMQSGKACGCQCALAAGQNNSSNWPDSNDFLPTINPMTSTSSPKYRH